MNKIINKSNKKSGRPVLSAKKPASISDLNSLKIRFENDEIVGNAVQLIVNNFTHKLEMYLRPWINKGMNEAKLADITIDKNKIHYTISKNAFIKEENGQMVALEILLRIADRSQGY